MWRNRCETDKKQVQRCLVHEPHKFLKMKTNPLLPRVLGTAGLLPVNFLGCEIAGKPQRFTSQMFAVQWSFS